jgi:serine/threonine protein kinase/Tol biopolymer transport system component
MPPPSACGSVGRLCTEIHGRDPLPVIYGRTGHAAFQRLSFGRRYVAMSDEKRDDRRRSAPERLDTLLGAVLELPPDERDRWIDESSTGNALLRQQLREMLRKAESDAAHQSSPAETEYLPSSGPRPSSGGDAGSGGSGGSGRRTGADEPTATPLVLGQHVGRYHVLDLLGAGGMGRVYRALDATLGREVAIKGLSDAFRGDSRSLRRFEREARVLATLSHPNIAAIYGFERLNGSPYLVLERVEGETLAQRLVRGPLPIDEALAVAVQIIAGLEEAHAKGVIHRDLKPSNVMLTPARQVKLVDFGLAKTPTVQPDEDESVGPITEVGVVVGTARYMSPEQVKGEDIDTRTDVWAFGCVLYEMLTARPAFAGRSVSEVAAAVLRDEADWSALPSGVPRAVVRLLRRCLRRDPRTRLQHIGDARIELVDLEQDPDRSTERMARAATQRRIRWSIVTALLMAAVAAVFVLWPRQRDAVPPVRLSLELPAPMTLANEFSAPFALAPAGSLLAIEAIEDGTRRLYVRELRDPALRRLAGTEGARQPFFSADGQWVAFFTERKLAKVAVGGGPVLELADIGGNPRGATWTADGTIVLAATQTAGLLRVPDRGGRPVALTTLDKARGEYSHRWPDALPATPWVLFTVGLEDATFDEGRIEAVSLDTGERRIVLAGAGFARYMPGGRLLFVRGGRLYAVGFDAERVAVQGTPEVILDAVRYDWRNGGSHLAVSTSGVLLYGPGEPMSHEYYLSWVDRDGHLRRAVDTPRRFRDWGRSPDGRRIAAAVGTSTESDLWSVDANATLSRLSFGLSPYRPTWTADGSGITVGAQKDDTWRLLTIPADGGGEPAVLLESPHRLYPNAWTPDGRHLLFQESGPTTGWDIRSLQVDQARRPIGTAKAFASSPFHETNAAISPDGRWVAYESDELDGVVQVYVRSWPDGGHKVRASSGGARSPVWGVNGDLYYWQTGESLLRVVRTRESDGQLTIGTREPVWKSDMASAMLRRVVVTLPNGRFDIEPSGARFLVLEKATPDSGPTLRSPIVVLGGS